MIDALSFTGIYPFRNVSYIDFRDVINELKDLGFEHIYTVSIEALFSKTPEAGNNAILSIADLHKDFIKPIGVVYTQILESNLRRAKDMLQGFVAIAVAPIYQGFRLGRSISLMVIKLAQDLGLPVVFIGELERQWNLHRAYLFRYTLRVEDLKIFLREIKQRFGGIRILLASFPYDMLITVSEEIRDLEVFVDFSHDSFYGQVYDRLYTLVNAVGEDLVVLSTKAPLSYPLVSIFRLRYSEVSSKAKEKIAKTNILRFYKK